MSSIFYILSRCSFLTFPASGSIILLAYGLVAQLGAHHIRIVGVEGSNPFKSTKKSTTARWCSFHC